MVIRKLQFAPIVNNELKVQTKQKSVELVFYSSVEGWKFPADNLLSSPDQLARKKNERAFDKHEFSFHCHAY